MSKLALLGGEKAVKYSLADILLPVVREKAYGTINDLCRKGEISQSPIVGEFEKRYADYIGTKYALCVPNGTTSIQAALYAVGVGPGDEVIVPSYTFWASVGPVVVNNAIPIFADVDLDSHVLSAETIEKKITPKTKAIVVVHVWGMPADMDPIMALAKKHGIKVIEDCSHAHGASYNGKKLGSIGDCGCFSMQGTKCLVGGEAGIMTTNSREYYEKAVALGHYERLYYLPESSPYHKYLETGFGYKHRVHPLAIAIADACLDDLDRDNATRIKYGRKLDALLSDLPFLVPQKCPEKGERIYGYHYARYIPEKLKGIKLTTILAAAKAEGAYCSGSDGYGFLHKEPLYMGDGIWEGRQPIYPDGYVKGEFLPNSEELGVNGILLAPRFEKDLPGQVEQYSEVYHKIAENADELVKYEIEKGIRC